MKYIKSYMLFEKLVDNITLYHGGLEGYYDDETKEDMFKKFDKFHSRTSYFSDNPMFALEYADRKTSEGGYDADIYLYTCKFSGNLFDYRNEEDFSKLEPLVPDVVEVSHGTFWYTTAKLPKSDVIKALKGISVVKPNEKFVNANIGDKVPNPVYSAEEFIVVDKDEENVYTITERDYNYYKRGSSMGYDEHFSSHTKYKEIFEPWRNAIVDAYNKNTGNNYPYPKYSSFKNFYHTYQYSLNGYDIDYVGGAKNAEYAFNKEDHKRINGIYDECMLKFDDIAKKELHRTEWNIKVKEVPMESNWNYYETSEIVSIIQKLGYDGYIALEDKHRTYAIYRPDEKIKIIKCERGRSL